MNKTRREALSRITSELEQVKHSLDTIAYEERDALEGLPEGLQSSERGEAMAGAIDALDSALDSIDSALDSIADASE